MAKRALTIAAAGAHNVLMLGPPGSGKTHLLARLALHLALERDLRVLVTSDIVDQFTDYVEIVSRCLTGLPEAADPYALDLAVAPRLRSVVLLVRLFPIFLLLPNIRK